MLKFFSRYFFSFYSPHQQAKLQPRGGPHASRAITYGLTVDRWGDGETDGADRVCGAPAGRGVVTAAGDFGELRMVFVGPGRAGVKGADFGATG